jgi:hypothetical protein
MGMLTIDELTELLKVYRGALAEIRDHSHPDTKVWRLANNALRRNPKAKVRQPDLFDEARHDEGSHG